MPKTSKKQAADSRVDATVLLTSRPRKPMPEVEKATPSKSSARTLAEKAAKFQQLRAEAMKRWRSRQD
jgi:hypothetical protein